MKFNISIMRWIFPNPEFKTIKVVIPKGWMNCGVTVENNFVADTNNSNLWDSLKFPLPKPKYKWRVKSYTSDVNNPEKKTVLLIDKPKSYIYY